MVKFIESEFGILSKKIDEMWTLVYNQLDRAGESVLSFDRELAEQILVREKRVNALELKIDRDIEDVIDLYNPIAVDLRFILALLKINSNLERLGDFADGIARFVIKCKEPVLDPELIENLRLSAMVKEVLHMLEQAKKSFDEENVALTSLVFQRDLVLDEINGKASEVLASYIAEHPDSALLCLDLVGVFRKLERAGDHITNIAEEIVFYLDAKIIKHQDKSKTVHI